MQSEPSRPRRVYWLPGIALLAALGALGGWMLQPDAAPEAASSPPATAKKLSGSQVEQPAADNSKHSPVADNDPVAINASGYVLAKRFATVSADMTGRLTRIEVEEGDFVAAGDLLAAIDDRILTAQRDLAVAQLETSRRNYAKTQLQLDEARSQLARLARLKRREFTSEQSLESARYAVNYLESDLGIQQNSIAVAEKQIAIQVQQLESTRIYAPFSGVVTEVSAQIGEIVSPMSAGGGFTRTGICTIIDLDNLEVEVEVSEQFIQKVFSGQPVTIQSAALPGKSIDGQVEHIMPQANRETASVTVKISIDKQQRSLSPNMRVDVAFLAPADPLLLSQSDQPTVSTP